MNYYELRDVIKTIVPRRTQLEELEKAHGLVKEKGRKSNYREFNLDTGIYHKQERLLNTEEINSFLEVSLRAAHCPMPLNADVWDGLRCGFGCRYCFADSFRSSLYTSFFDNSKNMGLRHCNPIYFKSELDKLMKFRGKRTTGSELQRAIGMQIPIRLGIRFEDFLPIEGKQKISLQFLQYLAEIAYPVMINTKSTLIGREDYVRALADNQGGAAVHITMLSADDILNKKLEPGAPTFKERIQAARNLTSAGIRVVARIEPFMVFVNDKVGDVMEWVSEVKGAGIHNITLDTYSWSASAPGIRRQMEREGIDFDRMFLLMSDSQWLGSLLLSKFIEMLKANFWVTRNEVSCSTFDFGNVPNNDQNICCEVGDCFPNGGFSWGNNLMVIRYIVSKKGLPATWTQYNELVENHGGWLSETIKKDVFLAWNLAGGNPSYYPDWAQGVEPCGLDRNGHRVWKYNWGYDFRLEMLKSLIGDMV